MASFGLFLQDLDASLQSLTAQVERATTEKISCQEDVTQTNQTIELANRLVKGLEVNKGIWSLLVPLGLTWHKVNCQFAGGMHEELLLMELHQ